MLRIAPAHIERPSIGGAGTVAGEVVGNVVLRQNAIRIRMYGGRLPVMGNYMTIGEQLFTLGVVTPVAGADFDVEIGPETKVAIASGAPITFDDLQCRVRQFTPVSSLKVEGRTMMTVLTLDLVQA